MPELTYEEIPRLTKDTAVSDLRSGEHPRVVRALLSLALFSQEQTWVKDICVEYARSPNENIRGIAILCLGHLARIHGTLDVDSVIPVFTNLLNDQSSFVSDYADIALSDVLTYCIPASYSRTSALRDLESGNLARMLLALSSVSREEEDWRFAQEKCIEYFAYPDMVIQGTSMMALATIASIHRRLDFDRVVALLESAAQDSNAFVSRTARSAIDCINVFLPSGEE